MRILDSVDFKVKLFISIEGFSSRAFCGSRRAESAGLGEGVGEICQSTRIIIGDFNANTNSHPPTDC